MLYKFWLGCTRRPGNQRLVAFAATQSG